jgi:hypothetical protein
MSFNLELAAAARWVSAEAERLPENARPDIALEWDELIDTLEDCRSEGTKELAIVEWRADMEERLFTRLLHTPLPARNTNGDQ